MADTQSDRSSLVIEIRNAHAPNCGTPPAIEADPNDGVYRGYFENELGEQWLVEINREARTGVLRGGDLGWDNEASLRDDRIYNCDVLLGAEEIFWLGLCWKAATGVMLQMPKFRAPE